MSSCIKTNVKECSDAFCAMQKSGTDFEAIQSELITSNGITVPDHKAIYNSKTNKILSVMGKDYEVFQPSEIFALADAISEGYGAKYNNVLVSDGGTKIQIEMSPSKDDLIMLPGGDALRKQLRVIGSFDGSTNHCGLASLERSLCKNLMLWQSIQTRAIKIRHTKNARDKVRDALAIWSGSQSSFIAYEQTARTLAAKIVDSAMVEKFLDNLIGEIKTDAKENQTRKINQREAITGLFLRGRGNKGENAWHLYNGASEYYDHHVNVKNPEQQLESILYGNAQKKKSQALDLALAL